MTGPGSATYDLAPPASAPADQSPPVGRGIGLLLPAIMAGGALVSRVEWSDAGDFDLVVTPLKFLRFDRDSGCCVDAPVHSKPNATKGRHDNV